jgi:exonuclease SbcC
MIPLSLTLSGFLSYRDPVTLDFTRFDLACISGSNGAGKSSLLDAITWALFGQARKRDESLIHTTASAAEVTLIFAYEANTYKIQRTLPRGKTSLLEFHIGQMLQVASQRSNVNQPATFDLRPATFDLRPATFDPQLATWKPLTEPTLRATQSRIESTLRLDYDTFVNASFFLQGKADQFTQQRPADRKRILASILGLEKWEGYRQGAADRRKTVEARIASLDGRLSEIAAELAEEDARKQTLQTLNLQLTSIQQTRQTQEKSLESVRQLSASLGEQRKLVASLTRQVDAATRRLDDLTARLASRQQEKDSYTEILSRSDEIQAAYQSWQQARADLAAWDATAEQFREQEKRRQPYLDEINAVRAGFFQEQKTLLGQQKEIIKQHATIAELQGQIKELQALIVDADAKLSQRTQIELQLNVARDQLEVWDARLRNEQKIRQPLLDEINAEAARLHQEKRQLEEIKSTIKKRQQSLERLQEQHETDRKILDGIEAELSGRTEIDVSLQESRTEFITRKTENDRLRIEMNVLEERIQRLGIVAEAFCPICGQPLTAEHRQELVSQLGVEGKEKGDTWRLNKKRLDDLTRIIANLEKQLNAFSRQENERVTRTAAFSQLTARLETLQTEIDEWQQVGMNRLAEITVLLNSSAFASEARQRLVELDQVLLSDGFDSMIETAMRDTARERLVAQVGSLQKSINEQRHLDAECQQYSQKLLQAQVKIETLQAAFLEWEKNGAPRLVEIEASLRSEDFAIEVRSRLAEVDIELKALGYDAAEHDKIRLREQTGRASEDDLRTLERAHAALAPLERELADLHATRNTQHAELTHLQADHTAAVAALAAAEASTPDLYAAERQLLLLQEQENRLRLEVGAAQQKVSVLDDLRTRRKALSAEREENARQVGHYKQLERAFGKDGVPALLIEQALPQIEQRANDLLERLSGGNMAVSFVTQAAYKDKKRDDLKETLDIKIRDGAGERDYEMFSGGEAFRVNFAVRLALSEVLAQRAGARLQTLVIDEGFGSQDAQGRQRLIEAINLVKPDFAKILVITHIDELKDAFPARIEVEKTERGSVVQVV